MIYIINESKYVEALIKLLHVCLFLYFFLMHASVYTEFERQDGIIETL